MTRSFGLAAWCVLLAVLACGAGCSDGRPKPLPPPSELPPGPVAKKAEVPPPVDESDPAAPVADAKAEEKSDDAKAEGEEEKPAEDAPPPAPRPSLLMGIMIRPITEATQSNMAAMQGGIQPLMGAVRIPGLSPRKPAEEKAPADEKTPDSAPADAPKEDQPTEEPSEATP